jgi:hypothetical protein
MRVEHLQQALARRKPRPAAPCKAVEVASDDDDDHEEDNER